MNAFEILYLLATLTCVRAFCPNSTWISPCTCDDSVISCVGNETIDLIQLFANLNTNLNPNEKHFKRFDFNNRAIDELTANTFSFITFNKIYIQNALNLTKIYTNAFNVTDSVTHSLSITSNPKLSQSEDNSLFEAIKRFDLIEKIYLNNNNITEIPDNAFGRQTKLSKIDLSDNPITKIGNNSFRYLESIEYIYLTNTSISYIPENAFAFEKPSNNTLRIDLYRNQHLKSDSFAINSFSSTKRPTIIDFSGTDARDIITYLDEQIFLPFLMANDHNQIGLSSQRVDCNDCRSYWLTKHRDLLPRLLNLHCSNLNDFNDKSNFINC